MSKVPDKWIKSKSDEAAVIAGMTWEPRYADDVRRFTDTFIKLSMDEWAGKPLEFMDWQWIEIIQPLYNWRKPDSTRRFSQASVWCPKNSGKSSICACLSLFELVGSNVPSANVIIVANTIEEANTIFRYGWDMVLQSEELDGEQGGAIWVRDNIKTMEYEATRSLLKVMSGEKGGKEGKPISFLCVDEIGWMESREMYESLRANAGKRKSGLAINISTAGLRRESIGYEEFLRCKNILAGVDTKGEPYIETSVLPVVYAAPADADWKLLSTAEKCNPGWNKTVYPDKVQEELTAAILEPRKSASYRTRRLNQWCGVSTGWLDTIAWANCGQAIDEQSLYGLDAFVGYDIGYVSDLSAYVLCIPKDGVLYLLPRFFCCRSGAERKTRTDKVPYQLWADTPRYNMYLTDGAVIDPVFIREMMVADSKNYNFREVGYDPTRGYDEFRQICERDYNWLMVPVKQSAKYLGKACSWFERAVLEKKIVHPNSAPLNWCLENISIKETPDGLYPHKGAGETMRIDGIIAALIGISRWLPNEGDNGIQFYTF